MEKILKYINKNDKNDKEIEITKLIDKYMLDINILPAYSKITGIEIKKIQEKEDQSSGLLSQKTDRLICSGAKVAHVVYIFIVFMCFIPNSLPARNEQVACSNQVSSSKEKPPKVGL